MNPVETITLIGWLKNNLLGPSSGWFWSMAQFFALAISLALIYRQVKIQGQANMLNSLKALEHRWTSREMLNSRQEVCRRCGNNDRRIRPAEEEILGFFEELGLYLKKHVFDLQTVWEFYSYYVEHYWCILQPHIQEFRAETNDSSWYSNFEQLCSRVVAYSKKKGLVVWPKTQQQIQKFIAGELEERGAMPRAGNIEPTIRDT